MQAIERFEVGSAVVKIFPDDSSDRECPITEAYGRNDKGEGLKSEGIIFANFEKRSTLSDLCEFSEPAEAVKFAEENDWEVFNLNKYEHGRVAYSISSGYPFNDRWDAGQVGYVLIKESEFAADKRAEIAESWCKAITTWCNGDYYGYVVENRDGDNLDSCWGYDDFDYCKSEATSAAKYRAEQIDIAAAAEAEAARPDMYGNAGGAP